MALKPCVECKKEISTSAKICPNCGRKNPTGAPRQNVFGMLVVLVILGYCFVKLGETGSSNSSASGPSGSAGDNALLARSAVGAVSARELWEDYDANEVAADARYKGKVFLVIGTVSSIDKDFMDNIVVVLTSPNQFMSVHATMVKSQASRAAALVKGQSVTVMCEVKGRIVGSPMLDDCALQ